MFGASASVSRTDSKNSGTSSQDSNVRRLRVEDEETLRQIMNIFGQGATGSSVEGARANALQDVQGSISEIFRQYQETALPQIGGQQRRTGGYNSTTGQLLANDAFARASSMALAQTADIVNQYETRALQGQQNALQGLSTALQGLLGAQETSTINQAFNSKSSGTTVKASASYGFN